mmetsp:Transcript_30835/g.67641  ORF Transcript_30835/g.67641 Transcript_30835/m.67641 type:complete len:201 (+) Transcript_30835:361-963(+)
MMCFTSLTPGSFSFLASRWAINFCASSGMVLGSSIMMSPVWELGWNILTVPINTPSRSFLPSPVARVILTPPGNVILSAMTGPPLRQKHPNSIFSPWHKGTTWPSSSRVSLTCLVSFSAGALSGVANPKPNLALKNSTLPVYLFFFPPTYTRPSSGFKSFPPPGAVTRTALTKRLPSSLRGGVMCRENSTTVPVARLGQG